MCTSYWFVSFSSSRALVGTQRLQLKQESCTFIVWHVLSIAAAPQVTPAWCWIVLTVCWRAAGGSLYHCMATVI
jgi:hypothetical protein